MKNTRNSNIELLRLLCILGIVILHSVGMVFQVTGINRAISVTAISIFNSCVSVFMLISGYYGCKFKVSKLFRLEFQMLFYSLLSFVILGIYTTCWSKLSLLLALLPMSTKEFWYITVYMIIFMLSPYINRVAEGLDRKQFKKLILIMIFCFSILSTLEWCDITGDGGKGVPNMLLMYFIGQYIHLYHDEHKNPWKMFLYACIVFAISSGLNFAVSAVNGESGWKCIFSNDNSISVVLGSTFLFLCFKNINIESRIINHFAKGVSGVYMSEKLIRTLLVAYVFPPNYAEKWYFSFFILAYAAFVVLTGLIIDLLRQLIFNRPEIKVSELCENILHKLTKGHIVDE